MSRLYRLFLLISPVALLGGTAHWGGHHVAWNKSFNSHASIINSYVEVEVAQHFFGLTPMKASYYLSNFYILRMNFDVWLVPWQSA